MRETLISLAELLDAEMPAEAEAPSDIIARLQSLVATREAALEAGLGARRIAIAQARDLATLRTKRSSLEADVRALGRRSGGRRG